MNARPGHTLKRKGAAMDEVTDIDFEDIGIPVCGASVGMFSGRAGIDQEGSVCSLILDGYADNLDGYKTSTHAFARIDVPHPNAYQKNWDQSLAELIARQIETVYADTIADKLNDWRIDVEAE